MKQTLIILLLMNSFFTSSQGIKSSKEELTTVIIDFATQIREQNGYDEFAKLFLNDSITWAANVAGKTKNLVLKQKPDFDYQVSTPRQFYDKLKPGNYEKFYNVRINNLNDFASIIFDYSFHFNKETINWGTECWSLIKINGIWKISSVTWSQNIQKVEACPFNSSSEFIIK